MCFLYLFTPPRLLAMKMLYYKNSWSCVAMSDMLAPTAKLQISGSKLVLAIPFHSLASSIRASSKAIPLTVHNLAKEMLRMDLATFSKGGGMCVHMSAGDFVWIPECCLVGEFSMGGDPDSSDISKSLSWVAMTDYHCSEESLKNIIQTQQTFLDQCVQPCQKQLESLYKASCLKIYVKLCTCNILFFVFVVEILQEINEDFT